VTDDWPQADSSAASLSQATIDALAAQGALARAMPAFKAREGQQTLAASVARAIAQRGSLVAEAGTGTGKTFAYLVPLLLSGVRVMISTGTRPLQDQLFHRDLPAVKAALGLGTRIALLKGRANYVCHHHLDQQMADGRFADPQMPGKLRKIRQFAQISLSGDRADCTALAEDDPVWMHATSTRDNCLGQECPEFKRCFVFQARREAMAADVVVVNHHLFCADLALRESSMAELLPTVDAVIFDEAHQLPEAATEFFGESVSTRQLQDLVRDLTRAGLVEARDAADWRSVAGRLEQSSRDLRLVLEGNESATTGGRVFGAQAASRTQLARRYSLAQLKSLTDLPDALDALSSDLVSISAIIANNAGRGLELDRCGLRATELLERVSRWSAVLTDEAQVIETDPTEEDPAIVWAEVSGPHATLRRTPLSVAAAFGRHRSGPARAWVFVSATLSVGNDFSHFTEALGLSDARCERFASPFDFAGQAALWIPRGIGEASAPGFSQRVAQIVWPLILANRGRAFVLCTSLRAVREIAQALRALDATDNAGMQWLVQGEAARASLLERFRSASAGVLVGSASFWEGVDVMGDALSLVVIDKLPFAPPDDPVIRARGEALRRSGRDPFSHDQLPAAAQALKQGAGRLIRSESDRGVLVICDERLITRGYGRRLITSLPPFRRVEHWQDALSFLPQPPGKD
jgi:ATP-dependent DNA helicase DinG